MADWQGIEQPLLLDTHVWIWAMEGKASALGSSAVQALQRYQKLNLLRISIISVWEVAMLASKNRLEFQEGPRLWIQKALQAPGLELLPLNPESAILSTELGDGFHPDPADRMLVATAIVIDALLVTADNRIQAYAKKNKRLRILAI